MHFPLFLQLAASSAPPLFGHTADTSGWRAGIGLQVDVLPTQTVESEMRQLPMLRGDLRYMHTTGIYGSARARAIVLSNLGELGAGYAFRTGPFAIAVHDHIGYFYGAIGFSGFDAIGTSVLHTPGATVSWRFGRDVLSLSTEVVVPLAQTSVVGSGTARVVQSKTTGERAVVATFTVEHTLRQGGTVIGGAALLSAPPDYQAWLAFSDERARAVYPRFFAGYAF